MAIEQEIRHRYKLEFMVMSKGITSRITEKMIMFLAVRLHLRARLFIRERSVASSLDIYCSLFSKSSLRDLNTVFQIRERIPVFFLLLFLFLSSVFSPTTSFTSFSSAIRVYPDKSELKQNENGKNRSRSEYQTATLAQT